MNANDLTFGVEFEVYMPTRNVPRVGGYHRGLQVADLPAGWNAQSDCSISCPAGFSGVEIVSPVLKGVDGLRQIQTVCRWLVAKGAKVNRSTGMHVHVGWAGDESKLASLAHIVARSEKALFASTGTKSRERSTYARPMATDQFMQARFREGNSAVYVQRYHTFNVTNLNPGSNKRTVEFRVFAGTTNEQKAIGYVRLCLGLVQKAFETTRKTTWVAKTPVSTSPINRGGEGATAVCRLFYDLGWTKGRSKTVLGNVVADDLPTIADSKKIIVQMANKYDAAAE